MQKRGAIYQARQRLIAAVCIAVIAVIYLAVYAQAQHWWRTALHPQPHILGIKATRPPAPPLDPFFIPDAQLPPIIDGRAPVIFTLHTKQPVVFLTIDDGVYQLPGSAELMRQARVKASLFLVRDIIQYNTRYFADMSKKSRSVIENHTLSHPDLPRLNYEQQKQEICGNADYLQRVYGKRPTLFRPPYGDYNQDTQRAAAACGMRAVVMWHAKVSGGSVQYQIGDRLLPGDIVLMHFRPTFGPDLQAFLSAAQRAGLHPELLEDWAK